jgi:hypothetical protein
VVGRVGRGRLRHNSHGRRAVKAPALSMVRDFLRASLGQAGRPACPQSSAWCVGDQSRARPLSVPPKSCVPSCRHWSSPGVECGSLDPGRRSRPHASPTAGDRTASRSSLSLGHDSVPVASSPRPVGSGLSTCGRVTSVTFAFIQTGARDSDVREGGSRAVLRATRGWGGRGAVLLRCGLLVAALAPVAVRSRSGSGSAVR